MVTSLSGLWGIFVFSFLMALTGAMAPGPLLTYTIVRTADSKGRGYLMGWWIILGHAILEFGIILLLLFGFSFFLQNLVVMRAIGVVGGVILFLFGVSICRSVYQGTLPVPASSSREPAAEKQEPEKRRRLQNPVLGGFVISMANPYWWVWWATAGLAVMLQFNVSLDQGGKLAAFFIGHEAGDLAWYLLVSVLTYFGIRHLNRKVYYTILAACGLFMILFGIYLGTSPFFKTAV